jgi:hypothetical protein
MLTLDPVLRALRLRRPVSGERCVVCQRRLTPADAQLAVRGLRVHTRCAGYRMRTAARAEGERHRGAGRAPRRPRQP